MQYDYLCNTKVDQIKLCMVIGFISIATLYFSQLWGYFLLFDV